MITPSTIISQALLRISGGELTPDFSVRWGEAKTYLAYAVNYVMTGNYWLETKMEGEKTINPLLLIPFDNVAVQYSSEHCRKYLDLPSNVITLPKGRALEITMMGGKKCFPLGQGDDALEEFYGKFKSRISYQLEGTRRVWLYNVPPLLQILRPKYIVRVDDLDDDAELLLPSDTEVKVVDMLVSFLSGEAQIPKDYAEDAKSN